MEQEILIKVLGRDVGICSSCGAKKGHACRRPSCPQLKQIGTVKKSINIPELRIVPVLLPQGVDIEALEQMPEYNPYMFFKLLSNWIILYPNLGHGFWRTNKKHAILLNTELGTQFQVDLASTVFPLR